MGIFDPTPGARWARVLDKLAERQALRAELDRTEQMRFDAGSMIQRMDLMQRCVAAEGSAHPPRRPRALLSPADRDAAARAARGSPRVHRRMGAGRGEEAGLRPAGGGRHAHRRHPPPARVEALVIIAAFALPVIGVKQEGDQE